MIIHVFKLNLKAYQLNLGITRSFIELYSYAQSNTEKPFFLYFGQTSDVIQAKYKAMLSEANETDYSFCKDEIELKKFVSLHRMEPYLLHGVSYKCMYLLIRYQVQNLNWVCWGHGSSINYKSWKSVISTPFKWWLYHHFRSTIVLLDGDRKTLERDYGMKNVKTLSYYGNEWIKMHDIFERCRACHRRKEKPVIYLGNSGHCMDSYFNLLEKFRNYAGCLEIHCMLQYVADKDKNKQTELIKLGKQLYGDNFYPDTEYMTPEVYLEYMNQADIYICGAVNQSGLGAISVSLALGKKVYITGKNYQHIIGEQFKAFELSALDETFTDPLDKRDSLWNYNTFLNRMEPSKQGWCQYLATL